MGWIVTEKGRRHKAEHRRQKAEGRRNASENFAHNFYGRRV
jgi:hypothetical protein